MRDLILFQNFWIFGQEALRAVNVTTTRLATIVLAALLGDASVLKKQARNACSVVMARNARNLRLVKMF